MSMRAYMEQKGILPPSFLYRVWYCAMLEADVVAIKEIDVYDDAVDFIAQLRKKGYAYIIFRKRDGDWAPYGSYYKSVVEKTIQRGKGQNILLP